jgi:hypothetical protein
VPRQRRDSELLERHVTISWPKGYSRAQASLRRIAVLHCSAETLVCRVDPADRRPAVQVQHVAAPGGGGGGDFFSGRWWRTHQRARRQARTKNTRNTSRMDSRAAGEDLARQLRGPLPSEPSAQRPSKAAAHVLALALATRSSACPCHAFFRL